MGPISKACWLRAFVLEAHLFDAHFQAILHLPKAKHRIAWYGLELLIAVGLLVLFVRLVRQLTVRRRNPT